MMNVAGVVCRRICQRSSCTHLHSIYQQMESYTYRLSAPLMTSALQRQNDISQLTGTTNSKIEPVNKMDSIFMKLGFYGKTNHSKANLNVSAVKLYVACTEYADYELFKERFLMRDTLACWVNVVQLHIWMLMMRLRNHDGTLDKDLRYLITRVNSNMWMDVEKRVKKLATGSLRKEGMKALADHYQVSVIGYDEGYFTDDKTLAGAVWRFLLAKDDSVEPKQLLHLVDYIHKNLSHLSSLTDAELLAGCVSFIALDAEEPNHDKDKRVQEIVEDL